MKTKLLATLMLLSLLTSLSAVAASIRPVAANPDELKITPSTVNKTPGDLNSFFDVFVDITVTDLYGFDIKITWDNTLITFSDLVGGHTYLDTVWTSGFFEPLNLNPPPPYQTGPGYVRYAAVATGGAGYTGSHTLFKITFKVVKACNFPLSTTIHFDTVKLSDSNYNAISATLTDGVYKMSATVPDLEFDLVNPNPSKPYEYCKYIEVEVYVTHICAHLTDYDLKVDYDPDLLKFVDVDVWGVFGTGHVDSAGAGVVRVWCDPSSTPFVGDKGLLFTLTFHIEFLDTVGHIWRTGNQGPLYAHVSLDTTWGDLSFQEGTIPIAGVIPPSTQTVTVNLIQGDVDCNGKVDVLDLRTVAAGYDKTSSDPEWTTGHYWSKYNLKEEDNTIDIFDLVVVAVKFGYNGP
jgi:hypothetical protein